ncbi:MAG: AAA family ATPase [Eubacterium aggregans]|uniref:AAA domain (Dynein-related subfamily) n=1 Tax=Eubacterium aggregans TaxID=81409 RepID=A0A1H3XIU6_9FIRM|nr:AAA family ATPase [Eubacterium aggregans]MDD4690707.1 AAA family ATPase [Eubacterium aggregans]MEA5072622.1 AAA family ATPase [Eubacterium aggregans]SDZ99327.1 AAA domain (dynein-related subfamily) [Eubacterium aggregans]
MVLADKLREQQVDESLIQAAMAFNETSPLASDLADRIPGTEMVFYGKEIWEMCIAALLEGENILLSGPKATGKNILADNLCRLFGRPQWNTSFHVNTDSTSLIGTDTFIDNEVRLRRGSVYECAVNGGFGVFDEINMAKNDALVVLHSALDYRKIIDVPGYEKISLHPKTRFIGTMNYDYAGTKELNEALVSRFLVVDIPRIEMPVLMKILADEFPDGRPEALEQFAGIFVDLQEKAFHSEISTKAVDLRGIMAALRTIRRGLSPQLAITMGVVGKTFDQYEKDIVGDVIATRLPQEWGPADIFA